MVDAVQRAAAQGLAFGTAHKLEGELASVLAGYPYAKLVRFVVSGTEAVATAGDPRARQQWPAPHQRLMRDHGHVDHLMVKAGSGVVTQGLAEQRRRAGRRGRRYAGDSAG